MFTAFIRNFRGPFKPHEYGLVILPMTVVKRFHDCLLPTHDAVLETYEKVKHFAVKDGFLTKASGYQLCCPSSTSILSSAAWWKATPSTW